jgi:hAT family C-terminal dimerisation region
MKKCEAPVVSCVMEPDMKLASYLSDVSCGCSDFVALEYYRAREATYPTIVPLASDIVSAPACEAYAERLFSVCGDLTARRGGGIVPPWSDEFFSK